LLPLWNRPCRFQGGDRVPAGLPEGARVPSRRRFPWGSRETRVAAGSPEADRDPGRSRFAGGGMGPGHRRLRPEMTWIRTTAGLPEVERDPDSNESSTPRGNSRRRPDDGGGGRRKCWPDEVGVITTSTRGPLVLIPPGGFKTPIDHRLAGGRSGPDRNEDPHHEETRGVGPVTGTAGSESRFGRGGRHHFRLKAEGPL
jgi:hypothetical protein